MTLTLAALPLLLLPLALPARTQTAPQCREANEQAIATFKSTLPKRSLMGPPVRPRTDLEFAP